MREREKIRGGSKGIPWAVDAETDHDFVVHQKGSKQLPGNTAVVERILAKELDVQAAHKLLRRQFHDGLIRVCKDRPKIMMMRRRRRGKEQKRKEMGKMLLCKLPSKTLSRDMEISARTCERVGDRNGYKSIYCVHIGLNG